MKVKITCLNFSSRQLLWDEWLELIIKRKSKSLQEFPRMCNQLPMKMFRKSYKNILWHFHFFLKTQDVPSHFYLLSAIPFSQNIFLCSYNFCWVCVSMWVCSKFFFWGTSYKLVRFTYSWPVCQHHRQNILKENCSTATMYLHGALFPTSLVSCVYRRM